MSSLSQLQAFLGSRLLPELPLRLGRHWLQLLCWRCVGDLSVRACRECGVHAMGYEYAGVSSDNLNP